jgi:hypothetical protein
VARLCTSLLSKARRAAQSSGLLGSVRQGKARRSLAKPVGAGGGPSHCLSWRGKAGIGRPALAQRSAWPVKAQHCEAGGGMAWQGSAHQCEGG